MRSLVPLALLVFVWSGSAFAQVNVTSLYQTLVTSYSSSMLLGKSEDEAWALAQKYDMRYLWLDFVIRFPESTHKAEAERHMKQFSEFTFEHDTEVTLEEAVSKFHFNQVMSLYRWTDGGGAIRVDEQGHRVVSGPICFGNLQIVSGAFYGSENGQTFLAGTKIIYPSSQSSH